MRNIAISLTILVAGCGGSASDDDPTAATPVFTANSTINVSNPKNLPAQLPAQVVPVGLAEDYKPDLILLPSGELLLVMFQPQNNADGTYQENIILYRSEDGGRTWGPRNVLALLGREPYFSLTRAGVLFLTTQFIATDYRNTFGYDYAIVYRSENGGDTWEALPITIGNVPGAVATDGTITSRNILELTDDSLVMGVSSGPISYLWRSYDAGMTWQQTVQMTPDVAQDGIHEFFKEMMFYQSPDGSLLGVGRVGACEILTPFPGTQCPTTGDNSDRMALFRWNDSGASWALEGPIGDYYGQMYPAFLTMPDNSLLFTFTDRDLQAPLGVEVVTGTQESDGFALNFATDRVLVDTDTPTDEPSGGGFGNTVELSDGTLVTAYSYRDAAGITHAQISRWQL